MSMSELVIIDLKPKADDAPTPIRQGHWRNQYYSRVKIFVHSRSRPGVITGTKGPGRFLTDEAHPSAEIAEQRALENLEYHAEQVRKNGTRYLGPIFFPD
jgi:hypothetical protein